MEYFSSGNIRVDGDFARFGSKSYAINKINTVNVRVDAPHGPLPAIVFGLLTLIALVSAIHNHEGAAVVVGLVTAGITWLCVKAMGKRNHVLLLTTSSSEAQAFQSSDGEMIAELRSAIERAIAGQ